MESIFQKQGPNLLFCRLFFGIKMQPKSGCFPHTHWKVKCKRSCDQNVIQPTYPASDVVLESHCDQIQYKRNPAAVSAFTGRHYTELRPLALFLTPSLVSLHVAVWFCDTIEVGVDCKYNEKFNHSFSVKYAHFSQHSWQGSQTHRFLFTVSITPPW